MRERFIIIGMMIISFFKGQINIEKPNIDAIAIFTSVETPVSLHNGLIDINIPIYEIKTKGINIPIYLSYNSRGVKVEEIASSVGLGWNFNYGGMISRSVREYPDEWHNGYLYNDIYNDFFESKSKRLSVFDRTSYNKIDFVPDQFYYSIPNKSGKFIFNYKDRKTLQSSLSDLIINKTDDYGLIGWKIIDEKGNRYLYGKIDDGERYIIGRNYIKKYVQNNTPSFSYTPIEDGEDMINNTWFLLKIETPYGEEIIYEYEPTTSYYYRRDYDQINKTCLPPCDQDTNTGVFTIFSKVTETSFILKRITFPGGEIILSTENREDLIGGKSISTIDIYNEHSKILSYKLKYTIQESEERKYHNTHGYNLLLAKLDTTSSKRMFLSEVLRYNNEKIYKTILNYNQTLLPNRFSTSQDYWGYYNGHNNGSFLHFFDFNNKKCIREVNPNTSQAGLLTSIEYSSGEKKKFIYENNILISVYDFENVLYPNKINTIKKYETLYKNMLYSAEYDHTKGAYYKDITISEKKIGEVNIEFYYNEFKVDNIPFNCTSYQAWIEKDGSPISLFSSLAPSYLSEGSFFTNKLSSGKYRLYVSPISCNRGRDDKRDVDNFTLNLSYKISELEKRNETYGEGHRILQLIEYDSDDIVKRRTFEYSDENGKNSGILFGLNDYVPIMGTSSKGFPILYDKGNKIGTIFSGLKSNSLGYSYVKEYIGTKSENIGKISYKYTNVHDGGEYYKIPFHPRTDNGWLRGHLLSKIFYKNINGNYKKVREIINNYQFGERESDLLSAAGGPIGFKSMDEEMGVLDYYKNKNSYRLPLSMFYTTFQHLQMEKSNILSPDPFFLISKYKSVYFKPYYFKGGKVSIINSKVIDYVPFGKEIVSSYTKYYYTHPMHYNLTFQRTVFPNSSTVKYTYQYAHEKSNQYLIDKNMIGIPLETTVTQNGKLISKTETKYPTSQSEANQKTNGLPLPISVLSSDLETPSKVKEDITYTKYDAKGNLLEYKVNGIIPVTIIWGYQNTLPIAKIEGATYEQIKHLITDIIAKSNEDQNENSEKALISSLDNFRNIIEQNNYQITTYTHNPLIGVTSITPPSGIREVYIYDGENRLKQVLDKNGNILKEYQYHYKN